MKLYGESTGQLQQQLFDQHLGKQAGSWGVDALKVPYNFALNAVEGAVNFLFNGASVPVCQCASVPGLPDYMGFLEPLKANYYNPTAGLLEVGMGVLSLRGVGGRSTALLETAEAGNARYRAVEMSMLSPGQRIGRGGGVTFPHHGIPRIS